MKWNNTKKFNESVGKLAHLYSKYSRVVMDGKMNIRPRYEEVCEEDLKSANKLLKEIDTDTIIEELEEYLGSDRKQNQTVFNIFNNTLSEGMCWLSVFREKDISMFNCIPFTFRRYINEKWTPDEFCRYVALSTSRRTRSVLNSIERLKEVYGIEEDRHDSVTKPRNASSFSDIIQYEDKDRLLKRLHELIDGKGGADVGSVVFRAYQLKWITRKPTRKEFESEFKTKGCWTAIYKYLNETNGNACYRANNIVFFDALSEKAEVKKREKFI